MSAIVNSIHLPQQKFFVVQEKLATPNFRKVFCNKKTFLLRRNFFCVRSNFFVKSFCATKSFLFEENFLFIAEFKFCNHQKTFSEKFSDITHIMCAHAYVRWSDSFSLHCDENFCTSRCEETFSSLRSIDRNRAAICNLFLTIALVCETNFFMSTADRTIAINRADTNKSAEFWCFDSRENNH